MARNSEYSKLTITGAPDSYGGFDISDIRKDINRFVNDALKSALPEGAYFKVGEKRIGSNGQVTVDVYMHSADAPLARDSSAQLAERMVHYGSNDPRYTVSRVSPVSKDEAKALARDEAKSDTETTRFNKSSLLKIIGVLTLISDVTRRILSAVMTFSQQTVKDMVTAHNLGMSYESVRHYRHVETAHGMKEGTITNAVADIQTKFGNITSLDEKALEALAVVMGSKIEDMAKMGMGASNPEAVLGAILDAFNEKANAGYNSVGQYVGEAQARRELYSYLLKVSPQVADIFATMQEEQHNINSIYRYQADTFEKFSKLRPTKRGGNEDIDYGVMETLGETWNQLLEAVNQIKEAFIVGFAPVILPLIRRLADTRVGMTAEEKAQRNKENKEANSLALESTRKTMQYYEGIGLKNLSAEDRAYYEALKEYANELERANKNKGNIYYSVKSPNELKLMGLAHLQANIEKQEDNALMALGFSKGLTDVTDEEIADVASSFNYDTEENRAKFAEYANKHNAKLPKAIAKAEESARKAEYKERMNRAKEEVKAEGKDKDSLYTQVSKRIPRMYRDKFRILLEAYKAYGVDYDLSDDMWGTGKAESTLFAELNRLSALGYILKTATGNYFANDGDYYKLSEEGKQRIRSMFPDLDTSDESLYLNWLYEKYKDEMNEDIRDMRVAQSEGAYKKARVGDTLNILYDTEGKTLDWRNKVPKNLGDSAVLYSVMDTSNGEKRLRFILEVKDGKKTTKTEVANVLGGEGVESVLGNVTYDTETKQPVLNVNMADSASVQEGM